MESVVHGVHVIPHSIYVLPTIPPTRPPLIMTPKLLHTILFFILVTLAYGQNVIISYPPPGTKVKPGKHLRVQIARPVRSTVVSDSDWRSSCFFRTHLATRWRS